jgi:hypothetical protein
MVITATAPTIEGIRTFQRIPAKGMRYLSVNLAGLDVATVVATAATLNLRPELVQVPVKGGSQIHALLWEGAIVDTPSDMDDRLDELWDRFGDAVCYAAGESRAEYLARGGVEYASESD